MTRRGPALANRRRNPRPARVSVIRLSPHVLGRIGRRSVQCDPRIVFRPSVLVLGRRARGDLSGTGFPRSLLALRLTNALLPITADRPGTRPRTGACLSLIQCRGQGGHVGIDGPRSHIYFTQRRSAELSRTVAWSECRDELQVEAQVRWFVRCVLVHLDSDCVAPLVQETHRH